MLHSLWAPKPKSHPTTTTTTTPLPSASASLPTTPTESLLKLHRLIDRLRWKSDLLLISRSRALSLATTTTPTTTTATAAPASSTSTALPMFALDFYEFYVLLERTLLLLLSFFNVRPASHAQVPYAADAIIGNAGRGGGDAVRQQQQRLGYAQTHRFHANVLEALDRAANPLHAVLGQQPVRGYLGRAKEFRNRWKEGGEGEGEGGGRGAGGEDTVGRGMVEGLELEGMVEGIMEALGKCVGVVEREVERRRERGGTVQEGGGVLENAVGMMGETVDCHMEDAPWETVDDAMEWEGL